MSDDLHLIKLVSGNAGSKRITIPKEIVEKLGISNSDYVAMVYKGNKKALIAPARVTIEK